MAQPAINDVHVNVPLTNISIAYMQSTDNFIADRVFPTVPVQNQANRYWTYDRDAWFRSDAEERAPGTESMGTGFTIDNTPTYFARVYAVHDDVSDQIRANSDFALQPDQDAAELVTQQLLILREKTWASTFFKTGIWTGTTGGTDLTGVNATPGANQFLRWDQAGSTPIEDVRLQAIRMSELTGFKPNKLVLSPYVALQLVNNPEIVDRVKYTQLGFLDYALLAQAFGVDEVLVPFATNNTATEKATLAMSFIYGKNALLCYAAPSPGLRRPSAGYLFAWKGYLAGTSNLAIKKFRLERIESDRVEGKMAFDMKQIGSDLGCFFSNAVN